MARSDYYIRKKTNVSTINYYKYKLIKNNQILDFYLFYNIMFLVIK